MNLNLLYPTLAAIFVASQTVTPYPGDYMIKIVPIACLLCMVLQTQGDWRRMGIVIALVFSMAGDIAMERDIFIYGLSAFLLAHIAYLGVFAMNGQLRQNSMPAALIVLMVSSAVVWFLLPYAGDMAIAIMIYAAVITSVVLAAILRSGNHLCVIAGAILFTASDTMIVVSRFVTDFPASGFIIMITYYAAQYLLTTDARKSAYATGESQAPD